MCIKDVSFSSSKYPNRFCCICNLLSIVLASTLSLACLLFFLLSVMEHLLLLSVPGARQVPLASATASRGPRTYSSHAGPASLGSCLFIQALDKQITAAGQLSPPHSSTVYFCRATDCWVLPCGSRGGTQVLCRTSPSCSYQ